MYLNAHGRLTGYISAQTRQAENSHTTCNSILSAHGRLYTGEALESAPITGESAAGGNSVCVAMDTDTGELLVIYEWSLQCRTVKKGDTRRLKQVGPVTVYQGV